MFRENDAHKWESENKIVPWTGWGWGGVRKLGTDLYPLLLVCLDSSSFRALQRPLLSASPTSVLDHFFRGFKIHTVILLPLLHRPPTSASSLTLTLGTGSRLCPGLKFGRSNSNSERWPLWPGAPSAPLSSHSPSIRCE